MTQHKSILKSASRVSVATTLSRIFGYVRDACLASVLGAGFSMDAFTVAYRLANLFRRLVAENTMNSSVIPVYVQFKKENTIEAISDLTRRIFYTFFSITIVLTVLQIIFAPLLVRLMAPGFVNIPGKLELTVALTRVMAPYIMLISLAAVLSCVLNSFGVFFIPALNPMFLNISMIFAALLSTRFSQPVFPIAIGVLIGGALQCLVHVPSVLKQGISFRPAFSFTHPVIRKIGKLMAPGIVGIGILQINLLVDSIMASFLNQGAVSYIYYADRVMELVLGIFIISLSTVILPNLSEMASSGKIEEFKKTLVFSFRVIAFVAIPSTAGLIVLSQPIVHVLFQHGRFTALDTDSTAFALIFFAVGLFFISTARIVASAFHSFQDTKTPVKVAIVALLTNVVFNLILMHPLKQGGIALATSIAAAVNLFVLLRIFTARYGLIDWQRFKATLLKVLIASIAMSGSCVLFLHVFHFSSNQNLLFKAGALFGTILVSLMVYLLAAIAMKVDDGFMLNKFLNRKWTKNPVEPV